MSATPSTRSSELGATVGFDVGGTFTDIVVTDAFGAVRVEKTLTTPSDPSVGARAGIETLLSAEGTQIGAVTRGVHGTTLVTNAIIEARGARTGLLTTRGFEDLLEIGGGTRYDLYDLRLPFRPVLVERALRRGVIERIDHTGAVVTPLDEDDVQAQLALLVEAGVEAVAVCLLHAYRNPAHEQRIATIVRELHPQLAVSVSSAMAARIGEYERLSTVVANTYVTPLMTRYLDDLDAWLSGGRLLLMASHGGTISVETAQRNPIAMIESGPAAGVLAAAKLSRRMGRDRVISFDMGGTTAKICVVDDGEPTLASDFEAARVARFKPGSGIPLRVPVVHLLEIGAGGGSVARVDDLGLLKVGPQSAGADPGPACYGLGGSAPTVTDANLALGYLAADSFLGGEMALDAVAARRAIADALATRMGIDAVRAAWGVHDVVNESMASAMRTHVAECNRDPRRYALVAFGGAGPVHAAAVARKVGVPEVIVPLGAGVMSAFGLLSAPTAIDAVRSEPALLSELDAATADATLRDLEAQVTREIATAGVSPETIVYDRVADVRYAGQAHEISVALPGGPVDRETLKAAFERDYAERYTLLNPSYPIEILAWRVHGRGPSRDVAPSLPGAERAAPAAARRREIWIQREERFVDVPVLRQRALPPGQPVAGPAIVEQAETTTVIGPGDFGHVDADGTLIVTIEMES